MTPIELKSSFANEQGLIHLNNAGLAPSSKPAFDQVVHWMRRFRQEGMHCNDAYLTAIDEARIRLAAFLNCRADEIAYFQNTASAISQVAFGLDLKRGDQVLTWDQEYPSNLYPWKAACDRSGAELVRVTSGPHLQTDAAALVAAITDRTRVIAISWVQYLTGAITELGPIVQAAKQRGIWTVIDAIQGIGLMPFDFAASGVDAICGGSHKWMLSPVGLGYLAIRSDRIHELRPLAVGAATYGTCDDLSDLSCPPKTNAWKFEAGSKQVLEILAMSASADLLGQVGLSVIQKETEGLANYLAEGLTAAGYLVHSPHGAKIRGSIVSFSERAGASDPSTQQIEKILRENNMSFALRGPGVRLSPHAFNQIQDLDLVLHALRV